MFIQTRRLALQIWHLSKVRTGWLVGNFGNVFNVFPKSPLLPCIPHRNRLFWLNSPDTMEFSSWKRSIICCARKRVLRSSWILNECNLSCIIVKNSILSEVCMIKNSSSYCSLPQMWCIKSLTLFRLGFFGQSVTGGGGAPRTPPLYLWNQ